VTQVQIDHDGTGYRVFVTETGLDKRHCGPRWATPRQAIAYSELVAVEHPSPLRSPAEPSPTVGVPPFSDGSGVDGSAGDPRGRHSGPGA